MTLTLLSEKCEVKLPLTGAAEGGRLEETRGLMSGFAKIFASMLRSTVWVGQPPHVKLTWITLLMLADADGNVWASVPGLAKDAEVTDEQCDEALALFMAPDRRSRTKAHEGRRVIEIDGGWHILNHLKYRELQTRKQALHAARQRDYYERKKTLPPPGAGGFDTVAPAVSSVSADAPDAQTAAESAVYGSKAPKPAPRATKPAARSSVKRRAIAGSGVSADAPDEIAASASVDPDQSLGDPDPAEPDLIFTHPAKDRPARARRVSAAITGEPSMTSRVPPWWAGPKPQHVECARQRRLSLADEAARFRLVRFKAFPATEDDIDDRFHLFLLESTRFSGEVAPLPKPASVPGMPLWVHPDHAAFADEHRLELRAEGHAFERAFERTHQVLPRSRQPGDVYRPFMDHLRRAARAAERAPRTVNQ